MMRGVGIFANQPIAAGARIGVASSYCWKMDDPKQDFESWPRFSAAGTEDLEILAYFSGPLSCLNGSCSNHANVLVDFHLSHSVQKSEVFCTTSRKIDVGEELLYNYTSDTSGVLTGHTEVMLCAFPGCMKVIATVL